MISAGVPCKLCRHGFLSEDTCECECHIITKGMLELNDNDASKVLEGLNSRFPIIDTIPKDIQDEMLRIARKTGPNADLTLLTDKEYQFVKGISNIVESMRKK